MTEAILLKSHRTRTWATRISFASAAPIGDFGGRFIRTIILSRWLSPTEFGTSVALSVVIAGATMISDIGLDRFVLLQPEPKSRETLAVAHAIQLIRGLVISIGMVLIARPAANFFAVPDANKSFVWAAAIPLLHSWTHLGPKQAQRDYDFRPDAVATLLASGVSALLAIPSVWLTGNHNSILVCLITSEIVRVIGTHALYRERFEIGWDRGLVGKALRYGLPLTLNGVGLALFSQADRALVGRYFGVGTLGTYAVFASLAIVAMSPFYAVCSSLSVSMIARNRLSSRRFPNLLMAIVWGFGLFGFVYCAGVGLTLDLVVPVVFGDQYKVTLAVQVAFAMIVLVRVLRGPPSVVLLVDGGTMRLTLANLLGGSGLVVAALFVHVMPTLGSILLGILVGDILSLALLQWSLVRREKDLLPPLLRVIAFECVAAAGLCLGLLAPIARGYGGRIVVGTVAFFVILWMTGQLFVAVERDEALRKSA